ncbi:MAG: hypothetical protein ACYTGX_07405 [Planctomycetota bacterium]
MNRALGPLVILLVLLLGGGLAFFVLAPGSGGAGGLGGVAGGPGGDGQDGGSEEVEPLDPVDGVQAPSAGSKAGEAGDGSGAATQGSGGSGAEAESDTTDTNTPTGPPKGPSPEGVTLRFELAGGGKIDKRVEFRGFWVAGTDDRPSMEAIGSIIFAPPGDQPIRLNAPDGSTPRGDGKTIRMQLQTTSGPYRLAGAGDAGVFLDLGPDVQTVTLDLLPSIRVEVLDAVTRSPLSEVEVELGYLESGDLPGWYRLFRPAGENDAVISAKGGYVPQRITLRLPQSGVSEFGSPILLERGLQLSGGAKDGDGNIVAVVAVAERTDGDPANPTFIMAPRSAEAGYAFAPLPAGRYRVMWFAKGMAPHAEHIDLQSDTTGHDVTLRSLKLGPSGNPRPYSWAGRKNIKFPLSVDGLNGLEILSWVEEILGATIKRDREVEEKLKDVHMSVSFTDLPVTSALQMFAQFTGFEFDADAGAFIRPKDGEGK